MRQQLPLSSPPPPPLQLRTVDGVRCHFLGDMESWDFEVLSHRLCSALVGHVTDENQVWAALKREAPVLARQLPRDFDLRHFYQPLSCCCFYCDRDARARLEQHCEQFGEKRQWDRALCYQCTERNLQVPSGPYRDDARFALLCEPCRRAAVTQGVCRWCASVVTAAAVATPSSSHKPTWQLVPFPPTCTGRRDWRHRDDTDGIASSSSSSSSMLNRTT